MNHPWVELKELIKQHGRTQKGFSVLIWKKNSEVNELIKGKRNMTIQWDYLLYKILGTYKGYRIKKQYIYEYQKFLQELPEDEKKAEIERIKIRRKKRREKKKKAFDEF